MNCGNDRCGGSATKRRGSPFEILILCWLGVGGLIMVADFAAIEGHALAYLSGVTPWYLDHLPVLATSVVLLVWSTTRRRLGTWAVGVGLLAEYLLVCLVIAGTLSRVDYIPVSKWLSDAQRQQAEAAIGSRIFQTTDKTGHCLVILSDTDRHARLVSWIAANPPQGE